MSKRIKFPGITGETIDLSNFWADKLKREEQEEELKRKMEEQEVVRINEIKCPVCKSTDKIHYIKRNDNGIVRFFLPDYFYSSKFDFEKEYFETNLENFNKFIIK